MYRESVTSLQPRSSQSLGQTSNDLTCKGIEIHRCKATKVFGFWSGQLHDYTRRGCQVSFPQRLDGPQPFKEVCRPNLTLQAETLRTTTALFAPTAMVAGGEELE